MPSKHTPSYRSKMRVLKRIQDSVKARTGNPISAEQAEQIAEEFGIEVARKKPKRRVPSAFSKLSLQRTAFVREYLLDYRGAEAALRAGYAESGAAVTASRLLKDEDVKMAIAEAEQIQRERHELTLDRVLVELWRIATADIRDVCEIEGGEIYYADTADMTDAQAAAISEITLDKDGKVKVKMHNKIAAIDQIAKIFGLHKFNLNVHDGRRPAVGENGAGEQGQVIDVSPEETSQDLALRYQEMRSQSQLTVKAGET